VAFSPDGRTLAIASTDGAVQLRDVSYLTSPLAQLCARLGGSITPAEWARYVPEEAPYRNVEGDAEHLPFGDTSFDTVLCALSLCTIPSPAAAVGEMRRVLVPGGRLLLLDHIASTWLPVYAAQWLIERVTIRTAGEHFTRRQLPLVKAAGFQIMETERLKAGTVERIDAIRPA
jgi:SAM-dependent methyltransferase